VEIQEQIGVLVGRHAFSDFRWLDPAAILIAEWVRIKCQFGCPHYARAAACPPNTPSVDACRRLFSEYQHALMFHFTFTEAETRARHARSARTHQALISLERDVFLAGYPKAFALFTDACQLCDECVPQPSECKQPALARPSATGMAIDVFGTARRLGYPVEVLPDPASPVNYFGFLLVD
jgi:predicted metal-binding protein